jgi:apolipoprotein N-acyltransferase
MTPIFYIYGSSYEKKFKASDIDINDFKIRVIGSNISLDRFYKDINPVSVIKDLIEISDPKKEEKTIFVWPEGILPDILQKDLVKYNWLFKEKFNDNHLLVIGINSQSNDQEVTNFYNSLSIYDHNLKLIKFYNKINLVPFGEFLPFENVFKKIGLKSITNNYQSFSKGDRRNIIKIHNNNFSFKFLPLICYEIIYSGKIFNDNNFDFIINISEDGWFGKSVGPKQHFTHSIFRSIESGKYILRSANNGIAAIINPIGDIEQKIDFGKSGHIDFNKSRKIQPTVFSKYGNKIFVILILMYIFLIFSFNRNKNE